MLGFVRSPEQPPGESVSMRKSKCTKVDSKSRRDADLGGSFLPTRVRIPHSPASTSSSSSSHRHRCRERRHPSHSRRTHSLARGVHLTVRSRTRPNEKEGTRHAFDPSTIAFAPHRRNRKSNRLVVCFSCHPPPSREAGVHHVVSRREQGARILPQHRVVDRELVQHAAQHAEHDSEQQRRQPGSGAWTDIQAQQLQRDHVVQPLTRGQPEWYGGRRNKRW